MRHEPAAAWRLEGLGFERVYDYVPGKADWFASGLPKEGRLASVRTIGDAAGSADLRPGGEDGKRMQDREATAVLVTMSDGRLVGLLFREDAEQLACRPATCRPKPWIGCCSTISPHRRHKVNQYPGVIPACNRGFGTRSRSTG